MNNNNEKSLMDLILGVESNEPYGISLELAEIGTPLVMSPKRRELEKRRKDREKRKRGK